MGPPLPSTLFIMAKHQNSERQRRHGFSDFKRQKIHIHYQSHPHLLQNQLAQWATNFFCCKINQSLISKILSDKFKHFNIAKLPHRQGKQERKKDVEQPLLEETLFKWHQRLQNSCIPISGELIHIAATQL